MKLNRFSLFLLRVGFFFPCMMEYRKMGSSPELSSQQWYHSCLWLELAHWCAENCKLVGLQLRSSSAKGGCDLCGRKDAPFLGDGKQILLSLTPTRPLCFQQVSHQRLCKPVLRCNRKQNFLFIIRTPQRQFCFHWTEWNFVSEDDV